MKKVVSYSKLLILISVILFLGVKFIPYPWYLKLMSYSNSIPSIHLFLRDSKELITLHKKCFTIDKGDTVEAMKIKMKNYDVSDYDKRIIFWTEKHSADLCEVKLENVNGEQRAKKINFLFD